MSYNFTIEPRDVLFFRDARPMEASDAGLGAQWPRPDQAYSAFINAFHRRWPVMQEWEVNPRWRNDGRAELKHKVSSRDNKKSSFRFGALKTAGPFPLKDGVLYFPAPADLQIESNQFSCMGLIENTGNNLPKPLTRAVAATVPPSKVELPQWISVSDYSRYLSGAKFSSMGVQLYSNERNVGIGIDANTHSTESGKLYQAEYLRLLPGVSMSINVDCRINDCDVVGQIATEEHIIFGGQQGVAQATKEQVASGLPQSQLEGEGLILKWTLLTPAIFNEGWRPGGIADEDGKVVLKGEKPPRENYSSRQDWRSAISQQSGIKAQLIAARIGKPLHFSGWDTREGSAKKTHSAVPAGSVYYFQCQDRHELEKLSAQLSWHDDEGSIINRRSDVFGEKGFGLGVCSIYQEKLNH